MRLSIQVIKEYQKSLGYDFDTMSLPERMQYFRDCTAALIAEQGELMEEVPFKPWRNIEDQKFNKRKAMLEWSDNYLFLVNQGLAIGFTPEEMEETVFKKVAVNTNRIKSGYNNTQKERRHNGTDD